MKDPKAKAGLWVCFVLRRQSRLPPREDQTRLSQAQALPYNPRAFCTPENLAALEARNHQQIQVRVFGQLVQI